MRLPSLKQRSGYIELLWNIYIGWSFTSWKSSLIVEDWESLIWARTLLSFWTLSIHIRSLASIISLSSELNSLFNYRLNCDLMFTLVSSILFLFLLRLSFSVEFSKEGSWSSKTLIPWGFNLGLTNIHFLNSSLSSLEEGEVLFRSSRLNRTLLAQYVYGSSFLWSIGNSSSWYLK